MSEQDRSTALVDAPPAARELTEEERREAMERFSRAADRIAARNADKDPDEEMAFITEVVEEVRQARYEREQREARVDR